MREERRTRNGERGTENEERRTRKGERGTRNGERGTGNGKRETGNGKRETGNEKRDNSPNSDRTLDEIIKPLVKKCKTLLNNVQGYGKVRWICQFSLIFFSGKISS